jgi:hypothetical protein
MPADPCPAVAARRSGPCPLVLARELLDLVVNHIGDRPVHLIGDADPHTHGLFPDALLTHLNPAA